MKDRIYLILTAIAGSIFAWAFFKYFGADALNILMTFFLVLAGIDNYQLRRQLRQLQKK